MTVPKHICTVRSVHFGNFVCSSCSKATLKILSVMYCAVRDSRNNLEGVLVDLQYSDAHDSIVIGYNCNNHSQHLGNDSR